VEIRGEDEANPFLLVVVCGAGRYKPLESWRPKGDLNSPQSFRFLRFTACFVVWNKSGYMTARAMPRVL
jgi:hypothetical protein